MSLRPLSRISPIPSSDIHPSFDEGQSNRGGVPSEIKRGTRAGATTAEMLRGVARVQHRGLSARHEGDDDVSGVSVEILLRGRRPSSLRVYTRDEARLARNVARWRGLAGVDAKRTRISRGISGLVPRGVLELITTQCDYAATMSEICLSGHRGHDTNRAPEKGDPW